MEVLLAGDWHANPEHAIRVLQTAGSLGIGLVLQVGDLGFWPRHPQGRAFLDGVSEAATDAAVEVWFCDGNHEDHASLPHDTAAEPQEVVERVRWVPRGVATTVHRRRILFLGGAVSIDQERRTPEVSWFPTELPSAEHWERALGAGEVDVVVAHDTVPGMPVSGVPSLLIPWSVRRRASDHRRRLEEVQRTIRPALWVHGHWHQRASATLGDTRFESLAHDRAPFVDSVAVLDLEDLSVRPVDT